MGPAYEPYDLGKFVIGNSTSVVADFSQAAFNTVGDHGVIQIAGLVAFRLIPVVRKTLTSGGAALLKLGALQIDSTETKDYFVADTDYALLNVVNGVTGKIWNGTTPTFWGDMDGSVVPRLRVASGLTIIEYTVSTADLTDGQIEFVCRWAPLLADSTVEPLDGNDYA